MGDRLGKVAKRRKVRPVWATVLVLGALGVVRLGLDVDVTKTSEGENRE